MSAKGRTLAAPSRRGGAERVPRRRRHCRRCRVRVGRLAGRCGYCGERQLKLTSPALFVIAAAALLFFLGKLMGWF